MRTNRIGIPLFLLISILCIFGCGRPNLFSAWRDREIVIDGKYTDWGNYTVYYNEKTRIVINLLNDRDYLYICLISRNREIETQLMDSGLILWLDPDGGVNKVFGIRFPVGMRAMGMPINEPEENRTKEWSDEEGREGIEKNARDREFEKRLEALEGLQEKLEILTGALDKKNKGAGQHELSLEESAKFGIEARIGRQNGYFVYELKVPLVKSSQHPYAIETKMDMPIGLGLEIGGAGLAMMDTRMGGQMPPQGGRMPEDRGGMSPGSGGEGSLKLWATVTLSPG